MDEPKLEVIPAWPMYCQFDSEGRCALHHGQTIQEHSVFVGKPERITREEWEARKKAIDGRSL